MHKHTHTYTHAHTLAHTVTLMELKTRHPFSEPLVQYDQTSLRIGKTAIPIYVLYAYGIVHLILSLWMVLEYFVVNWPNFRLPKFYYRLKSQYV